MNTREKILNWFVDMAARRRKLVLIGASILTVVMAAAAANIKLDVRWSTLLPRSNPVVQEFEKIDANYLQPGNMIVALSGPDPVTLEKLTDEATALLQAQLVCPPEHAIPQCKEQKRYARYVYGKLPETWMTEHALRLAKPKDAKRVATLMSDSRLTPFLTHLNDDFEAEYSDSENVKNQERQIVSSLDAVLELARTIDAAANGEVDAGRTERTVRDLTMGRPYLFSLDNSMSLVMVASAVAIDDFETMPLLDKRIEQILAPLAEANPDYRIERTGMTAIGRDEMDSIGPQTQAISMIALVLVFLMLVWNFKSTSAPFMALVPIILGIIWAMGIIGLTIGMLNLITIMVMVVLLGLGIDFSIHIANRFTEELAAGESVEIALRRAVGETGVGVLTGAVTTAVAFFTLMSADTKGISEFGLASGVGVLTTLLGVLWVMPALLASSAVRRQKKGKPAKTAHDFTALGRFAQAMGRHHIVVLILGIALTAAGIFAGTQLRWEWNFMELEPEGLRSILLQDEIIDKYKLSVSFAMLTAGSVEESRALRKKFKSKRLVGEVDDISMWVSRPDFERSKPHIARLRSALAEERPPLVLGTPAEKAEAAKEAREALATEVDRLWANLVEIQALSFTGGQDRVVEKTTQLVARRDSRNQGLLKKLANRLSNGTQSKVDWAGLQSFADGFGKSLHGRASHMAKGDGPVSVGMVPADILARYTSATAPGYLIQFFPKDNLYEKEKLESFRSMADGIHPRVTGTPHMILEMCLDTMQEGKVAVLLALIVILIVLLIDFRRPLIAILTFVPLLTGMAITFGIMWLTGEKLNYLNMIGLPVIVGIGVDDGVHFFHRYLQEGRGGLGRAVTSVGRAMLMTSLTTMIGFGSLMLYLMRGMASLGFVLFVGVGACFVVTITLLPALATLFEDRLFREKQQ